MSDATWAMGQGTISRFAIPSDGIAITWYAILISACFLESCPRFMP